VTNTSKKGIFIQDERRGRGAGKSIQLLWGEKKWTKARWEVWEVFCLGGRGLDEKLKEKANLARDPKQQKRSIKRRSKLVCVECGRKATSEKRNNLTRVRKILEKSNRSGREERGPARRRNRQREDFGSTKGKPPQKRGLGGGKKSGPSVTSAPMARVKEKRCKKGRSQASIDGRPEKERRDR